MKKTEIKKYEKPGKLVKSLKSTPPSRERVREWGGDQGKGKLTFDEVIKYEKPVIVKQSRMSFPIDIMEAQGRGVVCKQCSSCHSCR